MFTGCRDDLCRAGNLGLGPLECYEASADATQAPLQAKPSRSPVTCGNGATWLEVIAYLTQCFARLLLHSILKLKDGTGLVHFGMVCSSWITISRGTTQRCYFCPLGDETVDSVAKANILCSRIIGCSLGKRLARMPMQPVRASMSLATRMVLAIYLILAKKAVWVLEQPTSSIIWYHPRMRQLLYSSKAFNVVMLCELPCRAPLTDSSSTCLMQAWRASFWMLRYGSRTPKHTRLWSNSKGIAKFQHGSPLTRAERLRLGGSRTLAKASVGPDGKKRFSGKKDVLRKSGRLIGITAIDVCCCISWGLESAGCLHQTCTLREYPVGFGLRYVRNFEALLEERSDNLKCDVPALRQHIHDCSIGY